MYSREGRQGRGAARGERTGRLEVGRCGRARGGAAMLWIARFRFC